MARSSSSSSSSRSSRRKHDSKQKNQKKRSSSSSSRSASRGKKNKGASARKRSRSGQRSRKTQQGGHAVPAFMGYGGQPQQMFMAGLWQQPPPPWAMPGMPIQQSPQDKQKRDKKEKKDKKHAKKDSKGESGEVTDLSKDNDAAQTSKFSALQAKVDTLSKEAAEKSQAQESEIEKLKGQLAEKETRAKELEATETQRATREQQVRSELRAYAKQLNAKNGEIRQLQEEREKHDKTISVKTQEITDLKAKCAAESKKRKDGDNQIAHLSSAREGLLASIRKMKEQYGALKTHVKKLEGHASASGAIVVGESNATSEVILSDASAVPSSDGTAAIHKLRKPSRAAIAGANGSVPHTPRPQKMQRAAHSEPQHRDAAVGASCLGSRGQQPSAKKQRISFDSEEGLIKEFKIKSYAGLEKGVKRALWTPKAGSTLACDACSIRVPLAQGNLQLDPTRSQFMQERFLCITCGGEPPGIRPAANLNLLLADAPAATVLHAEANDGATLSPQDADVSSEANGQGKAENDAEPIAAIPVEEDVKPEETASAQQDVTLAAAASADQEVKLVEQATDS